MSPCVLTIGAARFITATCASAAVRPTGRPPARRTPATSRVLMLPASTPTTTSNVAASVTRRPSTWRFGIPAAASAASISRPPPCTTVSWATPARAAIPLAIRATSVGALEQLPSEFEHDALYVFDAMTWGKYFYTWQCIISQDLVYAWSSVA